MYFQIALIDEQLKKQGVKKSLLQDFEFDTKNDLFAKGCSSSYELRTRLSARHLIKKYAESVSRAQVKYLEEVTKARCILVNNIEACIDMDSKLGDIEYELSCSSDEELKKLPDGTKQLKCPILSCHKNVFRLPRHLDTQHQNLTDSEKKECITFARMIANNRKLDATSPKKPEIGKKAKRPTLTHLVNRKNNYKSCSICGILVMNISQHISKKHKMERSERKFLECIEMSETVPKCYTKIVGREVVKLEGEELKEAKAKYDSTVDTQMVILEDLKGMRNTIKSLKRKIDEEGDGDEDKTTYKKKLADVNEKYKELRYRDHRTYTSNVKRWKSSFNDHLVAREHAYPLRGVHMAMDVLLPFEKVSGQELELEHLMNGKILRSILEEFRNLDTLTATSKVKYLKMFKLFIQFLLCDPTSPERKEDDTPSAILGRGVKLRDCEYEIDMACTVLSKKKGRDMVETRRRAEKKLMNDEELDTLMNDTVLSLAKILKKTDDELNCLKRNEILDVRNCLMAAATLRLGRRTGELIKMTTEEVKNAKEEIVEGVPFYIVKVLEQKDLRTGQEAPIAFSKEEFDVLKIYISKLRPKIIRDQNSPIVFPPTKTNSDNDSMTYGGAYKILQKFMTSSGNKISTRSVRRSRITNSRSMDLSDQQKKDMAASMSHTLETAEKYYNYKKVTDSVVSSLAARVRSNTVAKDSTTDFDETLDSFDPHESHAPQASTPLNTVQSPLVSDDQGLVSSDSDANYTLRQLRSKKIMSRHPTVSELKKVSRKNLLKLQ